ncbi:lipoyl synthase [Candidatus Atribacteria bacterium HGW-Atribacteria-1]|nr:MAG: lipoyl synthase [Candidatus Atribacteria bacterium HGW-Atribacteria-1]
MTDKKGHLYWLRRKLPDQKVLVRMDSLLKELNLHTVCDSALCPNRGECFKKGTATFMILGNICTRNCKFCAVEKGKPLPIDPEEPYHIAQAVKHLNLKHIVVTSVTRDDLPDGGAKHFARTIMEIKKLLPESTIEVLVPDFKGSWEALQIVIDVQPEVINHNIETVPRLYNLVRPKAVYKRSLELLRQIKIRDKNIISKSGIMVGLGEKKEEVIQVMKDLRKVDCDIFTIGQYLKPSPHHLKVSEYIHPDKFEEYQNKGMSLGFKYVASAPLVRSSYNAGEILNKI